MKKQLLLLFACSVMLFSCSSPENNTIESGAYTGRIDKVNPGESEIYVKTDDGKILELYFTDSTLITRNNSEVAFDQLAKDQTVEVVVEKVGTDDLNPISVNILN